MLSYKSTLSAGLAMALALGMTATAAPYNNSTANLPSIVSPPCGGYFKTLAQTYYPPNADCHDYTIPVDIEWDKLEFNATKWQDNDGLQDFLAVATTREPGPNYPSPLGPSTKVNGTYKIAATFCSPKQVSEMPRPSLWPRMGSLRRGTIGTLPSSLTTTTSSNSPPIRGTQSFSTTASAAELPKSKSTPKTRIAC